MITLECNCHSGCALGHVRVSRKFRLADECRLRYVRFVFIRLVVSNKAQAHYTHTQQKQAQAEVARWQSDPQRRRD